MEKLECQKIVGGLRININPDIIIWIYHEDHEQIYKEFLEFTAIEQRAHLNAVITERLSK